MKRVLQAMVVMVLMVIFSNDAMAQTFNYPVRGRQGFQLTEKTRDGIHISYNVGQMTLNPIDYRGESMSEISISAVTLPNTAGCPNLPVESRLMAIPQGATARLNVVHVETEIIRNVNIAPALRIQAENEEPDMNYVKDMEVYSKDAFYPEKPFQISEAYIRGVNAAAVSVSPFQYNPVTKELKVFTDIELSVSFEGGNGHFGDDRLRSPYWDPILAAELVNYDQLPVIDYATRMQHWLRDEADGAEYLIITPNNDAWAEYANQLKDYRTRQGIITKVYRLDEMPANSTSEIKAWFHNAYSTWEIAPVAVCLLGDHGSDLSQYIPAEVVSHPSSGSCITDNRYADVVGNDNLPDMVFSRLVAQNASELPVFVGKQIEYEYTNPNTDPSFYSSPITALGWQTERWFQICSEVVGGYMRNHGYNTNRINCIYSGTPGSSWSSNQNTSTVINYFGPNGQGYIPQTPSELGGWTGGTPQQVVDAVNAGTFWLQHRDHGLETGWGEPAVRNNHVNQTTNVGKLPFVMSINCLTGMFNYSSNCFAEAWMRRTYNGENAGAVGVLCPTEISYSFVNDVFVWGVYDLFDGDFMPDYGPYAQNTGNWMPAFGNVAGKYFLAQSAWPYNTNDKDITYTMFTAHCDAFLRVYTQVPQEMAVVHPEAVVSGYGSINVTAPEGCVISLVKENLEGGWDILAVATATGGSQVINFEPQVPPTVINIVVTGQNYLRYEDTIEVIPAEGSFIVIDSYTPNNTPVNQLTPLSMTFRNVGLDATTGTTTVTVSSSDDRLTIVDGTGQFGVLAGNQTVTLTNEFRFRIAQNVPDNTKFYLDVTMTCGSETWTGVATITAKKAVLEYVSMTWDGSVVPGETFNVTARFKNTGHYRATNAVAHIATTSPYVTFSSNTYTVGTIEVGEQVECVFTVNVSSTSPDNIQIPVTFTLNADGGLVAEGSEVLMNTCDIVFKLHDSFGDGWNGNILNVSFSDGSPTQQLTLESGNYTSYTLAIGDGIQVTLTWTAGNYISECSFEVEYSNQVLIYKGTNLSSSFQHTFDLSCSDQFNPLTITAMANPQAGGTLTGAGTYNPGESCTITATPQEDYTFINWTENGTVVSTQTSYTFQVYANRNFVANFSLPLDVTVTANPTGGGTVTGGGTYIYGTSVTVTATPNENYCFYYWTENGTVISSNATYTFSVTENRNLVANFGEPLNITVSANPSEGGTVSGAGSFDYGATATITATANEGYAFYRWTKNGSAVSYLSTYSFSVTSEAEYVAEFQWVSNGVAIGNATTTNSVLPSYSYYNYTLSQQIYTADEIGMPCEISNISFFNTGSQNTRSYTIYLKHTDKASFEGSNDWITVTEADQVFTGNVTMVSNNWTSIAFDTAFMYNGTSNLALIVDDNTGSWSYYNMSCRTFETSSSQSIYIYSDGTNYDPFNPSQYNGTCLTVKNQVILGLPCNITATANPTIGGTVSGYGSFAMGTTCTLTATPNEGFLFVNWTEDGTVVSSDTTYSFTVSGDRNLVANFADEGSMCRIIFDLYDSFGDSWNGNYLVIDYGNGQSEQITISSGSFASYSRLVATGSNITLSWIAGNWISECSFDVKFENGVPIYHGANLFSSFLYVFTLDCGEAYAPHTITAVADPVVGGTVEGAGTYTGGTVITMTATPNQGYTFCYWSENGQQVSTDASYSFAVTSDRDLVAHFSLPLTVSVTTNMVGGGTVTGGGTFNYGTTCTLTATPNPGYVFNNWTKDGSVVSCLSSLTINVTESAEYVANFQQMDGIVIGGAVSSSYYLPTYYYYSLTEQIYTAEEMGGGGEATEISSVSFYNTGTYSRTRDMSIYMVNTNKTSFGSNTDWIPVTDANLVFDGSVTIAAHSWVTIYFSTPFAYDGVSNVALIVDDNSYSYNAYTNCRTFDTEVNQALRVYSYDMNYDPSAPNSYTGTLMSEKNQVVFGIPNYEFTVSVSANPTEGGTVSGANGGLYFYGQPVNLNATPNEGYVFNYWTKNGEVVSCFSNFDLSVTESGEYVAEFQEINGLVVGEAANSNYDLPTYSYYPYSLSQQIYTAEELGGEANVFTSVSFFNIGSARTRNFTIYLVQTDKTAFDDNYDWITVTEADQVFSGNVTMTAQAWVSICLDTPFNYDGTSNVALVVDDNSGSWNYGTHSYRSYSTEERQSIRIYSSGTDYDPFNPSGYSGSRLLAKNQVIFGFPCSITATANPTAGGTVSGTGTYGMGASCTLTATPNPGYYFLNWTENGSVVSYDVAYSFIVSNERHLVANFAGGESNCDIVFELYSSWSSGWYGNYLVVTYSDGTSEQLTLSSGASTSYTREVPTGSSIALSWIAGSYTYQCSFDVKFGNGVPIYHGSSLSASFQQELSINCLVATLPHTIYATADPEEGGTVAGAGTYDGGETCTLTATPNTGYTFMYWTENGTTVSSEANYSFLVSTDRNLVAHFALPFTITATADPEEGGSVAGMDDYDYGTTCTLTAISNSGYTFCYWSENGQQVSTNASYSFTVTSDRDLVAHFSLPLTVSVTTNMVGGGTVTGGGIFNYGTTCTMTATPNEGYLFLNWSKNGEVVSCNATYSFTVTEDLDLEAVFMFLEGTLIGAGESTNSYLPSYSYYCYTLSQQIYTPNELGVAGTINSVSYFNAGYTKTRNYDIYMVHTDKTAFDSNTDWITVSEADLVYSGNVTMTQGYWTTITLDTPFDYDGTSNLAIIFDDNTGSWTGNNMTCRVFNANGNQAIRIYSDGTNYDPYNPSEYSGTRYSVKNQIILDITPSITQHSVELVRGWNWYSTYIELSDIDGLGQLENSIGVPNAIIQSQNNGYVKSGLRNGIVVWRGELTSINNEEMYKIGTKTACTATVAGNVTTPSEHPITINRGWNSIGFPCNQSVSVEVAMSGFTPRNDDVIKGRYGYTIYNDGTWSGTLNTLEPGQGYMYGTKSRTPRTLVFQTGRGETTIANITPENNFFQPVDDYADNMTLTAIVELDGEELRSDDYELAAFVGDECRGSVKLMYVEPIDRYIAFLTVFGDQEEELRFVLTDGENMSWSDDPLAFTVDGKSGTLTDPATLHFGASVQDYVNIFPNPSNGVFNVEGKGIRKVSVIDAFGQVVLSKEVSNDAMQIDLNGKAAGIYMLQIVTENGISVRKLIKK